MTADLVTKGPAALLAGPSPGDERRYVAWFHALDAWTEYWDLFHPESRGRYYFGDDAGESGLLGYLVPRGPDAPLPFTTWMQLALARDLDVPDRLDAFRRAVRAPEVAAAVGEIDDLVCGLFAEHFGDASDPAVCADYLEAMSRFARDVLPPATARWALVPDDDPRKRTAGRHTLDGDMMWFIWALEIEAAHENDPSNEREALHALLLAGTATGCAIDYTWRGHRRTRAA